MAKAKSPKVKNSSSNGTTSIVIQDITIGQVVRGNQTLQTWHNSLKSAESVFSPNRRWLINVYHDMGIDLHYTSLREKRILALQTIPFEWPDLNDDKIKENLASPWFFEMLGHVGGSIFDGYKVVECLIGDDGLIGDVELIPPQNVIPHKKLITLQGWGDESGAIHYTEPPYSNYLLEIGKPTDLGLNAKLAPYILLKRDNLSDFARFNEMFGMPLRWYEYDPNDPTARQKVTESAESQGSAAFVVVPKGTIVNFVDSAKTGQATYEPFHNLLNQEMSIGVLGQTLTTSQSKVGSNALGMIHQQVESEIAMKDRIMTEFLINYRLKKNILIPHGYPLQDHKGSFTLTEELAQDQKIKIWLEMVKVGVPIAEEDFYNEFGVPFPNGRKVVVAPAQSAPNPDDDPDGGVDDPKLSGRSTSDAVARLYASQCKHRHKMRSLSLSYSDELNKIIDALMRKLFEHQDATNEIAQLTELIGNQFTGAVTEGFGKVSGAVDTEMINALTADVKVFSGFKTEAFLREATALLVDGQNNVRTFAAFRDEILKLNTKYNVNFLQAEYNHAIGSAQMASKWVNIVKDGKTLPLLRYRTAGDGRVRKAHQPLNDIILPLDHPFWDTYMPPNDWNCRCNVQQLADGEQTILPKEKLPQIKDEFKFNPGKQKAIFPKSHPYYEQSK